MKMLTDRNHTLLAGKNLIEFYENIVIAVFMFCYDCVY